MDMDFRTTVTAPANLDLTRTIEQATAEIIRQIADDAPAETAALMPTAAGRSKKGAPPNRQSGNLARTLRATVIAPTTAEIEMAGYAEYLDPFFGGNLDRPFIETGIDRAIAKNI